MARVARPFVPGQTSHTLTRPWRARARLCAADRAACFQQMREPKLALDDVDHVLRFDPSNSKALARKQVYIGQVAAGL